jgi:hypothetical protein
VIERNRHFVSHLAKLSHRDVKLYGSPRVVSCLLGERKTAATRMGGLDNDVRQQRRALSSWRANVSVPCSIPPHPGNLMAANPMQFCSD